MSGPIDIVRCLHNAFRRDVFQIDDSAFKIARSGGDPTLVLDRLDIMGEVLDYHARGEEAAVFPAVDKVAPLVAEAYLMDHRELDRMVAGLKEMHKTPDPLTITRATAALSTHLKIHLNKEDAHLYRILREKTTESEQAQIAGLMSKQVPPNKFPLLTQWLFPLLDFEDQFVVINGWMAMMPPQVFAALKPLVKQNAPENWVELTKRIPQLNEK